MANLMIRVTLPLPSSSTGLVAPARPPGLTGDGGERPRKYWPMREFKRPELLVHFRELT
jgi:hypothetical protein